MNAKHSTRFAAAVIVAGLASGGIAACGGGGIGGSSSGGTASSSSSTSSVAPAVTFTIDSSQNRTDISPLIYGINFGDFNDPNVKYLTFNRFGGNRISAYNWENNASNAGSDYFNQNDNYLSSSSLPGAAFTGALQTTLNAGGNYLISVPMLGYVSADELGNGDVNKTANYLTTRFNQSLPRKGATFSLSPNLGDGKVYQDEMANFIKSGYPSAFTGSVARIAFMLDNEPDLWAFTHARLRGDATGQSGNPVTYAELFQKTEDYASALKDVAPNALIYGPASYGWSGYVNLQSAPDSAGRDFLTAYLAEMKAYETAHGRRILDVLDLHWYPEARSSTNVRITTSDSSDPLVEARLQAPRSLYDTSYTENSWISQNVGAIGLIPRIMAKINTSYPGTKLSFSEYDYGGSNDISGGVAEADVLGIFGREGVYSANQWPEASTIPFILGGFSLYRNYDGSGGHFGDVSVKATTTDGVNTAAYASVDKTGSNRVVLVLINRSATALTTQTNISHSVGLGTAHLYRLEGTTATPQDKGTLTLSGSSLTLPLPARSATTVVLTP